MSCYYSPGQSANYYFKQTGMNKPIISYNELGIITAHLNERMAIPRFEKIPASLFWSSPPLFTSSPPLLASSPPFLASSPPLLASSPPLLASSLPLFAIFLPRSKLVRGLFPAAHVTFGLLRQCMSAGGGGGMHLKWASDIKICRILQSW